MSTRPRRDGNKARLRLQPDRESRADGRDQDEEEREIGADDVRHAVARVEALADAASDALDDLPFIEDPDRRRKVSRLFLLVEATAEAAARALGVVERLAGSHG
jgi:hypothetical protein